MNKFKGKLVLGVLCCAAFLAFWGSEEKNGFVSNKDTNSEGLAEWMNQRIVDPQTGKVPVNMRQKELAFSRTLPKAGLNFGSRNEEDSIDFVRRGPNNIGGRTRAVAIDVANSSNILAGGVSGGMWRSADFGLTWKKVSSNEHAPNISCIAQDTRSGKTKTWYSGTGEGRGSLQGNDFSFLGNGMFKSTDNGVTWSPLKSTQIPKVDVAGDWGIIWSIAIDPSNTSQDEVYAAVNGAIMRSVDGGVSWTKELGGSSAAVQYTDVKVTSTGVVYAAIGRSFGQSNPGVYRSTDGENWTNITGNVWPSNYERIVFDICESDESELIFLARTPGSGAKADPSTTDNEYSSLFKYKYVSGNGAGAGGVWTNLSSNIPSDQNSYYTFDTQSNYNMMVKFDPFDKNTVYIGSTNLFRSTDGFTTKNNTVQIGGYNPKPFTDQSEYRYPNQHPDQHNLVFLPNNSNEAFSASDGGLSYTNNLKAAEVQWTFKNTGYFTSQFFTVAIDHLVKNNAILGGLQDNGTAHTSSSSSAVGWTDPLQSDGSYCAVEDGTLSDGSGIYYVSSQYGRTFKVRLDGSGTKTAYERIDPTATNPFNRSQSFAFINPFELDYSDNNVMYMLFKDAASGPSKIKVHKTLKSISLNDNSNTRNDWGTINYTFPSVITAMVSSRNNPKHRLYVGTANGSMFRVENANSSNPTVTRLAEITGVVKGSYVSDFAVHPDDANKVVLTFSNYRAYSIFYSEDGGDNWEPIAGNLEDELPPGTPDVAAGIGNGPSVRCAAILETDSGTAYFVGTSIGLFATNKLEGKETVWSQQSPTLIGNAVIEKMDTRDSDNYLAIATHGSGVFGAEVPSSTLIGTDEQQLFKADITVYPNPSKGDVYLELNGLNFTRFVVYDELGRLKLSTDINNTQEEIQIESASLNSGVYYLELIGPNASVTKKFVINK